MKVTRPRFWFSLVVGLTVLCCAQTAFTNESIIKMLKAGMGEDLVIATIKFQPAHYSIAPNDLIVLKEAGASDKVIEAMITKVTGRLPSAIPVVSNPSQSIAPASEIPPGPSMKETEEWIRREF